MLQSYWDAVEMNSVVGCGQAVSTLGQKIEILLILFTKFAVVWTLEDHHYTTETIHEILQRESRTLRRYINVRFIMLSCTRELQQAHHIVNMSLTPHIEFQETAVHERLSDNYIIVVLSSPATRLPRQRARLPNTGSTLRHDQALLPISSQLLG